MATALRTIRPARSRRNGRGVRVGPHDDGRRMSMALFARADSEPGYCYELSNGVVEVTDIPGLSHVLIASRIHKLLVLYDHEHPGVIHHMGGGSEAKIEMWGRQTERHPDLSVYLSPPPPDTEQPWDCWVPEIVVEIVWPSSVRRDYRDKADDYVAAGVREYWIIDPQKKSGRFLVRRVDAWQPHPVGPRGRWRTPLLPGFTLDLARLFVKPGRR